MDSNLKYIEDKKNIAVLLSAYSGHKYIEEQVNSILNQRYDADKYQLTLYIRDDSKYKDEQMHKYFESLETDSRVVIINKKIKNIGVQKSFYELLNYARSDYYFFSDQDDIWEKDKMSVFMEQFESLEDQVPALIYSDLLLIDGENNSLKSTMKDTVGKNRNANSFSNRLLDDAITGASMAINRSLRDVVMAKNNYFDKTVMHDSYLGIVASLIGSIIFIDRPLTRYRQHDNNVIGAISKKYHRLNPVKYIKRFQWVNGHYKQAIMAIQCLQEHNQLFKPENSDLLRALINLRDVRRFSYKNYTELVYNAKGVTDKIVVSYQWLIGIK